MTFKKIIIGFYIMFATTILPTNLNSGHNNIESNFHSVAASIINTVDNSKNVNIDMPKEYKRQIINILNEFPSELLASLERIKYKPDSLRRGLASGKSIYLNFDRIENKQELRRVFIHELGHIIDLGYLKSEERKITTKFKDGSNHIFADDPSVSFYSLCWTTENKKNGKCKNKDFTSKYASSDVFEDFAESFLLFIENNESFRIMTKESLIMRKKYNLIKSYLQLTPQTGIYVSQKKFKREWDLTIAY